MLLLLCLNPPTFAGNEEMITSLCNEGVDLYRKNQLPEALQRFQKAESIPPEASTLNDCLLQAPYFVGMIAYRQGNFEEARRHLTYFPVTESFYKWGMPLPQVILGNMLWAEGDYIKAVERYEDAVAENPLFPERQELKEKIQTLALAPVEERPKVVLVPHVYAGADLCAVKKPGRFFRSVGKDGSARELCTTVDGEASGPDFEIYVEDEHGQLVGSMYKTNSEMVVYLVESQKRTPVLQTKGHRLNFIPNPKKELPDIEVLWETYVDSESLAQQVGGAGAQGNT
jgi:hypothetical protein